MTTQELLLTLGNINWTFIGLSEIRRFREQIEDQEFVGYNGESLESSLKKLYFSNYWNFSATFLSSQGPKSGILR